ncbi:15286_t:CDS:2 [Entrophospora sp. SA101]|nr:15286_t:CDS:2 [Entrophospora sp. SA101]CAJ0825034.1 4089_t:CDS:2 [Entrophospora sp. SA101]CAJ0843385.1 3065_t:CDS:2 [Entrophospora sp. SA101]CAJ0923648.1 4919_t:CDS:2 [Entrophospora sp. SA101]
MTMVDVIQNTPKEKIIEIFNEEVDAVKSFNFCLENFLCVLNTHLADEESNSGSDVDIEILQIYHDDDDGVIIPNDNDNNDVGGSEEESI